ncbi:MAG: efflux transporter outer membrane subunit [Betaproteobacteria bacterium]|nr:efflux transporter outer membrane subunit [Betaproteobacteria bacterium]MDE2424088.1 efflux transporter outer membrane subunit [Betaproteobacteria bacterium]
MRLLLLSLFFGLLLSGCAVGPDFKSPAAPSVTSYTKGSNPSEITANAKDTHGATQHLIAKELPHNWWTMFGSEPLNQMVELALKNNPNLESLQQTLLSAQQSAYAQEQSLTIPSIDASVKETKQRFNPAAFGQPSPPSIFSLTNASVNIAYNLDIFGGIRRQIEAAYAQADAQAFTYEAARITLEANVVTTAIKRAAVKTQIDLTQKIIQQQEELFHITELRYQLGAVSQADVAVAKESLAKIKNTLPDLDNQYLRLDHQLAVYLGQLPSQSNVASLNLAEIKLPQDLPLSVPSELVHQRPDILVSEAQLHAATAQVGVALSGEYPAISINASYGTLSANPSTVFSRNSAVWSLSSGIVQPLFHGGALKAQTEAAQALLKSAALQYQQTVLNAFQNVADSISTLETDGQYLNQSYQTYDATSEQMNLIQQQFDTGSMSYMQLISAQLHQEQSAIALSQAKANRLNDTAAFFLALGGGWSEEAHHPKNNPIEK